MTIETTFPSRVRNLLYVHFLEGDINLTINEIDNLEILLHEENGQLTYMIFWDDIKRIPDFVQQEIQQLWLAGL